MDKPTFDMAAAQAKISEHAAALKIQLSKQAFAAGHADMLGGFAGAPAFTSILQEIFAAIQEMLASGTAQADILAAVSAMLAGSGLPTWLLPLVMTIVKAFLGSITPPAPVPA
jgi:hypothetical protein